ncbi:MAG: urocanate hydratase [Candidatus Eremiobacteraeota bacterium]|nr:urocanate hydratase [Candidatus Eremiobacteraeota bacterium]
MTQSLRCRGWRQEGLLRLLENVLAVGERPDQLIVYASLAKAARDWPSFHAIVAALKDLREEETLVIQSGKPVARLRTHAQAPLVVMANCNLVGRWATPEYFYELQSKGLIIWGGLTAAAWQYIGSQGVIQGTYEIFAAIAERHYGGSLKDRFILTAGLGGMGGAQPLAGLMAGARILVVEADEAQIDKRIARGFLQQKARSLEEALACSGSVGLPGNAADLFPEILQRGLVPDIVTDQTAAHDLRYGYLPQGYTLEHWRELRESQPEKVMHDAGTSIAREVRAMLEFQRRGSIVFDNGNNIRSQAKQYGVENAFDIGIFTEAYLRPLFCQGIGPFRWMALSGNPQDIARLDELAMREFPEQTRWIELARQYIPVEGLPARIAWLGHGQRTQLAVKANQLVARGEIGPIAFSRDHLDAASMTHPNIMTENMRDGSDAICDWPLLNAMVSCSSMADLVTIHSGGGGYAGYMTSSGLTLIADGTEAATCRLKLTLDNDTGLGVLRYADAGYELAQQTAQRHGLGGIGLFDAEGRAL